MGRLFCLFVCYGRQELGRAMGGGGSNYIEKGLQNGQKKVSIKGSSFWYAISSSINSS